MITRSILSMCALGALTFAAAPALAQVAAALGQPLPVAADPSGQVTVRVVDGDPSSPAAGLEVSLVLGQTPRVARTDASGRATFSGVPIGASAVVKVPGKDGEHASKEFTVPQSGGVRMLMSTTGGFGGSGAPAGGAPAGEAGGAGPAAGGAMPSPRKRSGQPIAWSQSSPDSLLVRLSYDDPADAAPPADQSVYLVAYGSDEKITVTKQQTDGAGKAQFTGLDVSGATAYFAMTILPRGATFDRLLGGPLVMPGTTGLALMLSAEQRTSTASAVDDVLTLQGAEGGAPAAGQVVVQLQGGPEDTGTVTLHDATTGAELAKAAVGMAAAEGSAVTAQSMFAARPGTPAGTLDLIVLGPDGQPMGELDVAVVPATHTGSPFAAPSAASAPTLAPVLAKSIATGPVRLANLSAGSLVAVVRIAGKEMRSEPFSVSPQGGALGFQAQWPRSWPQATVDASAQPAGKVVYAQTLMSGKQYRSLPFQLAPDRGARATLLVLPRVMFRFSLTSSFEEDYFAFRGRFTLNNSSWFPYKDSEDGLVLPLPKGFKGAQVTEEDAVDVAPVPGQGLRFLRPLTPGQRTIIAGWSMAAAGGEVNWDLALPFGAFQSGMELMQLPGMTVDLPPGVKGETARVAKGAYFVLPDISILPNQRMVMTIRGLPAKAGWKVQAPRIVGVLVLLILLGGVVAAFWRRPAGDKDVNADAATQAKINALLDELVSLDGTGNEARREALMAQLEQLWPRAGEGLGGVDSAPSASSGARSAS